MTKYKLWCYKGEVDNFGYGSKRMFHRADYIQVELILGIWFYKLKEEKEEEYSRKGMKVETSWETSGESGKHGYELSDHLFFVFPVN